jgi:hypothetical protein
MNQSRSASCNTAIKARQIASFSGKEKIVTVKQYGTDGRLKKLLPEKKGTL